MCEVPIGTYLTNDFLCDTCIKSFGINFPLATTPCCADARSSGARADASFAWDDEPSTAGNQVNPASTVTVAPV
jgi:hypothetical protein